MLLNLFALYCRYATRKEEGTIMSAIIEERMIEAVPQRIWGALTEPDEIEKWWADEAHVQSARSP